MIELTVQEVEWILNGLILRQVEITNKGTLTGEAKRTQEGIERLKAKLREYEEVLRMI